MTRLVFGFMTGTSIDAIDAAAARIEGTRLGMRVTLAGSHAVSLGALASRLRALAGGEKLTAGEVAKLSLDFSSAHAGALRALREKAGAPDLVAVHGQTVFHGPPASWQMLSPWPIAREAGCPVVYDLRGADLAAGGQGAPVTPLADWVLFRDERESRAIVNLGGFCNATILPGGGRPEDVRGLDVCACNHVLDEASRRAIDRAYDEDGARAASGRAEVRAVEALRETLARQGASGRSLGTGDEAARWVETFMARGVRGDDLLASAVEGVALTIAQMVNASKPDRVFFAGGGARNRALLARLARHTGLPAATTEALGVPVDMREALEIAALGALCADGVAITLPAVTGAPSPTPMSGAWAGLPGVTLPQRR